MKVQHVSIMPSEGAKKAKCIGLTPELLAATGARYSRSNDGLETIVSKIDWKNTDKSVDNIFKMVDYGHASIADMAPVAMFIDDISIYAAYYLWAISPTASGQESSTRYIKLEKTGVMNPEDLGIKNKKAYFEHVEKSFDHYNQALDLWTKLAKANPSVMKIPKEVIEDTSERGVKKLERMRRNYAFDRARVYLPVSAKTNVMLLMSARSWVELVSNLISSPLVEFQKLGEKIKEQLAFVTPRLIRHARYKEDVAQVLLNNFELTKKNKSAASAKSDGAYLHLSEPKKTSLVNQLNSRINRYSPCGDKVRMMPVTFGWKKVAFAEMRDLNRHRTGQKQSLLNPNSFHDATDQCSEKASKQKLLKLAKYGQKMQKIAKNMLQKNDPNYFYFTLLGHTYEFSHTTTLDKYIYEAELRTGVGAHYKYADHLRNTLKILYKLHPEVKGLIKEGGAEPE